LGGIPKQEARDGDDRHRRSVAVEQPDGLEPVHAGHEDVDDDDVELAGLHRRDSAASIGGENDVETLMVQHHLDCGTHGLIVVDYENPGHWGGLATLALCRSVGHAIPTNAYVQLSVTNERIRRKLGVGYLP